MLRPDALEDDLAGAGDGPFEIAATPAQLRAWCGRPVAADLIRVFVFLAPIAVALAVTLLSIRVIPPPAGGTALLAWWVGLTAAPLLVVMVSDRIARRLLPLAALLKLSLVFPDQAPSRFGVALRTGTTGQLARRVQEMHERAASGRVGEVPDGWSSFESSGAAELLALVAALNVHDHVTRGHSERVRALSDMIAAELDLCAADRDRLRWAALLHDIGKLAVPAGILNKRSRPTDAEWRVIETHPAEGERLIAGPLADWLGDWGLAVGQHHEHFDGSGYPRGLAGTQISLAGRLVAVADAFDVITSHRSYKRPLSAAEARAEITACAGSHFDPVIVRAFLEVSVGRLRRAAGPFTWLAQIPLLGRAVLFTPSASASTASDTVAAVAVAVTSLSSSFAMPVPADTAAIERRPPAVTEKIPTPIDPPVEVVGPAEVLPSTPAESAPRPSTAGVPDRLADSLRSPGSTTPETIATAPAALLSPPAPPPPPATESTAAVVVSAAPGDAHEAHRAAIREKLIAKHGECMFSESPPAGGRKCGHDQPSTAAPAPVGSSGPPDQSKVPPGQAKVAPATGRVERSAGSEQGSPGQAKKND